MEKSLYVSSYQSAYRRWAEGMGHREWEEWAEEVGKIKQAWKFAVAGMLTQKDRENPELWFTLGDAYYGGHGIDRDLAQAEMWIRKAAQAGHQPAMIKLGQLLIREDRTPEDAQESVIWFHQAADLGNPSGMTWMAFAYRDGQGVTVDERKAADWFIKAYHAGNRYASELAGRLLSRRSENHAEAVKWLRIAVEHDLDNSYFNLALIHENRESPCYDPAEAFRCWHHVADRPGGNPTSESRLTAMLTLAKCSRDGVGTEPSKGEAKRWLDRLMAVAPKEKSDYRFAEKLRREIDAELL